MSDQDIYGETNKKIEAGIKDDAEAERCEKFWEDTKYQVQIVMLAVALSASVIAIARLIGTSIR